MSYTSMDEAPSLIFALGGRGAPLAKADIKAAFKLIPVRADRWQLLGFKWEGECCAAIAVRSCISYKLRCLFRSVTFMTMFCAAFV